MSNYLFELNKYDEEYTKHFKDIINTQLNENNEYNVHYNIETYENYVSQISNVWFELKKDLDKYDLAQSANSFHFQEFIEKINN